MHRYFKMTWTKFSNDQQQQECENYFTYAIIQQDNGKQQNEQVSLRHDNNQNFTNPELLIN